MTAAEALAQDFFEVMATVCTPVAVVTAMDGERPHGTTVSAFASLSASPPMVLVSLDRSSDLLKIIGASRRFGLNILGTEHAPTASAFARKGSDKFSGASWTLRQGLPQLDGVPGWLACDVEEVVRGGDHDILLGSVLAAETGPGGPLTYHRRAFGTYASLDA